MRAPTGERDPVRDPIEVHAARMAAAAPRLTPGQLRRIGAVLGRGVRTVPAPRPAADVPAQEGAA